MSARGHQKNVDPSRIHLRTRCITRVVSLTAACLVALQPAGRAHAITVPEVPAGLEAPEGNRPYRVEHAIGTQNYMCLPSTMTPPVAWELVGPQATLFNQHDRQTMTHFQSPNPNELGTMRPTWQDSRDTSAVWAKRAELSDDPAYVEPGAIPWLLLQVVGRTVGPRNGHAITRTTWIQRINTVGGQAPATGCATVGDIGKREQIPYAADYVFYRSIGPLV